jgi:hypothetical protein
MHGVSTHFYLGIVSILMFWGMLEMGIAMVAICLPVLYRVWRHWPLINLLVRLVSWGSSKPQNSSNRSNMEMADRGNLGRPAWPQRQGEEWTVKADTASDILSRSNRAASQDSGLRDTEIWEHTEISQVLQVV